MITGSISRSDNVVWRRVDNDIVVIPQNGQQIIVLNKTAAVIWEMLDGECEIEYISTCLSERFDVSKEKARFDTVSIIETFIQNGIAIQSEDKL
jgi:hypothetical protein